MSTLKEQYPNSGYRMMNGLLQQQGIRVQHARIRDSMQRACGPIWGFNAVAGVREKKAVQRY